MEWQIDGSFKVIQTYKNLGLILTTRIKFLPKLTMKWEVLGWLIVPRSRHGHFVAYHKIFQHKEETDTNCIYGQNKRSCIHSVMLLKGHIGHY